MREASGIKLENVEMARSWHEKMLGLMFRKDFERALILELPKERRLGASIHTFFMRFPIDVLFLDSEKRIVDQAFNVRPWTFNVTPRRPARYVAEFRAGKAPQARIGEKVEWRE